MRPHPTPDRATAPHGTVSERDAVDPEIPTTKSCLDWMVPDANSSSRARSPDSESNDSSALRWPQFLSPPSTHTIHFEIRLESENERELDWTQIPAPRAQTKPGWH